MSESQLQMGLLNDNEDPQIQYRSLQSQRNKIRCKIILKHILKIIGISAICYGLLKCIKHFSEDGIKLKNKYTKVHVEYNTCSIFVAWELFFLYLIIQIVKNNMGIRLNCCNKLLNWLFIMIRVGVVVLAVIYVFPEIINLFYQTFAVTYKNSDEYEVLQKHDSWFNFLLCWIIWLIIMFSIIVFCLAISFYIMLASICGCQSMIKRDIRNFCKWVPRTTFAFILGSNRHITVYNQNYQENQRQDSDPDLINGNEDIFHAQRNNFPVEDDLQAFLDKCEQQYISGKPQNTFQEARDCPICLQEFTDKCIVVQLKCNKLHIYHKKCLHDMLKFTSIERKCAICRKQIEF